MPAINTHGARVVEQPSPYIVDLTGEEEDSDLEAGDKPLLSKSVSAQNSAGEETSPSTSGRLHGLTLWWTSTGQGICRWIWDSGMTCMLIASFIQALAALCVKATGGRVPIFEIVAVRSGICTAATIAIIKARGISPTFGSTKYLLPLFMRGATGAASISLYYFGLFNLNLADAMTIFFSNPAMTVALAWLLRGERVSWLGLTGIIASLLGVVLVAQPPFLSGSGSDWSPSHMTGVLCTASSAFLAASAFVSIRYIPKSEASFSVALWFHTLGFMSALLPLLFGVPQWPVLPKLLDCFLLLGVAMASLSSHFFIARSFMVEQASKVASVGYTQVLYGTIFGSVLLHESVSLLGILGSLVICVGVIAVSWPSKSSPAAVVKGAEGSIERETEVLELCPLVEDDTNLCKGGMPAADPRAAGGRAVKGDVLPGEDVRWLGNEDGAGVADKRRQQREAMLPASVDLLQAAEEGLALETARTH